MADDPAGTGTRRHLRPETVDEAYASRARYGAPDWQVDAWVSTYTAIAAGELAGTSDAVERIAGHPPPRWQSYYGLDRATCGMAHRCDAVRAAPEL